MTNTTKCNKVLKTVKWYNFNSVVSFFLYFTPTKVKQLVEEVINLRKQNRLLAREKKLEKISITLSSDEFLKLVDNVNKLANEISEKTKNDNGELLDQTVTIYPQNNNITFKTNIFVKS